MIITVLIQVLIQELRSLLSLIFSFIYPLLKYETGRISTPTERQELVSMIVVERGWVMNSYNRVLLQTTLQIYSAVLHKGHREHRSVASLIHMTSQDLKQLNIC